MLVTVILLGNNLTLAQQIAQTVVLMAFFLPFSYFIESMRITTRRRVGRLTSANPAASKMLRLPTWSSSPG